MEFVLAMAIITTYRARAVLSAAGVAYKLGLGWILLQ